MFPERHLELGESLGVLAGSWALLQTTESGASAQDS